MSTIQISLNGTPHTVTAGTTLATLIQSLRPDHDPERSPMATAVNGRHVAREQRASWRLNDNDAVTTFEPISGG